jgi:chorismate mutase
MPVRGIRGATVVEADHPEAVYSATLELLQAVLTANPTLHTDDLASAFFTVTDDISSAYPAVAARKLGWTQLPMLCAREILVPGGLQRCIRVLLHWNTDLHPSLICHVYLGAAAALRPDLSGKTLPESASSIHIS